MIVIFKNRNRKRYEFMFNCWAERTSLEDVLTNENAYKDYTECPPKRIIEGIKFMPPDHFVKIDKEHLINSVPYERFVKEMNDLAKLCKNLRVVNLRDYLVVVRYDEIDSDTE